MIKAPYNFVPLASKVVFPEWADKISIDIPFKDGISGTIEVKYTSQTPVFIGNGKKDKNSPIENYKSAIGKYALPGSSIRGMLRCVIEIASFSKFSRIDDLNLSFRDLHNKEYTKAFIGKNIKAGWFVKESDGFNLYPVKYYKISDYELKNKFQITNGEDALKRREALGNDSKVYFEKKDDKVFLVNKTTPDSDLGYVVLTGFVHGKKKDFIFEPKKNIKIHIEDSLIKKLIDAIEPDAANQKSGTAKLREQLEDAQKHDYPGIPVFYLEENDKPASLGLSQLYRLPYKNSFKNAIKHSSSEHLSEEKMDLVECIFGRIRNKDSLRGRVQFEDAISLNATLVETVSTILNNPKPSYYPNYIEQKNQESYYSTLMKEDVNLRGWKRYPVKDTTNEIQPTSKQDNLKSDFKPLSKGSVFEGKIHFHNLKRQELGALLWAITWNNNESLSHGIGMGKPYGFGQIKAKIKSLSFLENSNCSNDYIEAKSENIATWLNSFENYMELQVPNWKNSPQLTELFAMADPKKATRSNWNLQYMSLGDKALNQPNEFIIAKGQNKNGPRTKEYLAPYSAEIQYFTLAEANKENREKIQNSYGGSYSKTNSPKPVYQPRSEDGIEQGKSYTCILLEEKTKKGGWKVMVKNHGTISGPIYNSSLVPADKNAGDEIELEVKVIKGNNSQFEYIIKG